MLAALEKDGVPLLEMSTVSKTGVVEIRDRVSVKHKFAGSDMPGFCTSMVRFRAVLKMGVVEIWDRASY